MNQFWIKVLSVPLLAIALVSCPTNMGTGVKVTGIDASATPATIASAATSSLTATVSGTGAFVPAVDWSIVSGGGSLSSTTGSSVTYTAPSVTMSTAVQIKATSAGDSSVSKTVTVTVQPAIATPKPTINAFTATPSSLTAAGQVTLIWDVSNATSLSVDSGVGAVTGTSKVVSVASSTTFTLTATNAGGSSTSIVTVTVASLPAPPTVVSVSPADGATGVKSDAKIVVTFSQPMDQVATQAAYQSADLPPESVTFNWNASATEMTIVPNAPLAYATGSDPNTVIAKAYAFSLTSVAKDKQGNALVAVNSSFKTLRAISLALESGAGQGGNVLHNGDVVRNETVYIYAGDSDNNLGIRGFVSFNLSNLPNSLASSDLVSATLSVYKVVVRAFPYQNLNPCVPQPGSVCNVKWVPVNLDHVTYGDSLTANDYATPALTGSGTIDGLNVPISQYLTVSVLAAVRDDVTNRSGRENRSQYRLGFTKKTNGDYSEDSVVYGGSSYTFPPRLALEYRIP